ncbi:MAG: sel1 repeat family protein [Rhodoferax sp.]|nr:sel1 repeat family protein [Rhodoferax sp.]
MTVLALCAVTATAGPLEDADAAYNRQDYASAITLLRPGATRQCQCSGNLGVIYFNGKGVPEPTGGGFLVLLAAAQGQQRSIQPWLAYEGGLGVTQSDAEAYKWFLIAAMQGDEDGAYMLAQSDYNGKGVKQNYAEALRWFRQSAGRLMPGAAQCRCDVPGRAGRAAGLREALRWFPSGSSKKGFQRLNTTCDVRHRAGRDPGSSKRTDGFAGSSGVPMGNAGVFYYIGKAPTPRRSNGFAWPQRRGLLRPKSSLEACTTKARGSRRTSQRRPNGTSWRQHKGSPAPSPIFPHWMVCIKEISTNGMNSPLQKVT